jgi:transposase
MTLIGAISIEIVLAKKAIIRSMKGKKINNFVEYELVPNMYIGDVVVMDNLNIHKMEGIEEIIVGTGARVEYLST